MGVAIRNTEHFLVSVFLPEFQNSALRFHDDLKNSAFLLLKIISADFSRFFLDSEILLDALPQAFIAILRAHGNIESLLDEIATRFLVKMKIALLRHEILLGAIQVYRSP